MGWFVNRTAVPVIYLPYGHTPDFSPVDWLINPDLSSVLGVPQKYWKVVGETVAEMTAPEKAVVDEAERQEYLIQRPVLVVDDFNGSELDLSKWQVTVNIGNQPQIVPGDIANGILLLEAGNADAATCAVGTGGTRSVQQKGLSLDLRFRIVDLGGGINLEHTIGFSEGVPTEFIGLAMSSGNWYSRTVSGTLPGETTENLLFAEDTEWHRLNIQSTNGDIIFRVDNSIEITHATNIPDGPFSFNMEAAKDGIGVRGLYIDDVEFSATRVSGDTV